MNALANSYPRHQFLVPADREDAFAQSLAAWGCQGCQALPQADGRLRIDAYFAPGSQIEWPSAQLDAWRRQQIEWLDADRMEDRDWLAEYRRRSVPFRVGRFLIDPRDPDGQGETSAVHPISPSEISPGDPFFLRIPAQSAFGTGSHETTRLVLSWLQDLDLNGLEVVDVGTGSAILAFAALRLGARRVFGFDIEAQAVCIAHQNSALNGLSPTLFAGTPQALRSRPRFDLALVNVLPERIGPDLPELLRTLKPDARLLSSGNLTDRRGELLDAWAGFGFRLDAERQDGEWTAFLLRREGVQA